MFTISNCLFLSIWCTTQHNTSLEHITLSISLLSRTASSYVSFVFFFFIVFPLRDLSSCILCFSMWFGGHPWSAVYFAWLVSPLFSFPFFLISDCRHHTRCFLLLNHLTLCCLIESHTEILKCVECRGLFFLFKNFAILVWNTDPTIREVHGTGTSLDYTLSLLI